MIRILHAADLHLDSPFEGLPEEKAALRRAEQRELLRELAQLRAESGAQRLLLPGDIFDSSGGWAGTCLLYTSRKAAAQWPWQC